MLQYTVVFALLAVMAGLLGFGDWVGTLASIAKVLCAIFSVLTVWAVCLAVMWRRQRP